MTERGEDLLAGFERGQVDHEAIAHVALHDAVVSLVDLLNGDNFDVAGDIVLAAKVQHLLRFPHAPDHGAGKAAAARDERNSSERDLFIRNADEDHGAVHLHQIQVLIPVDLRGNGVHNEIERAAELGEGVRRGCGVEVVSTHALGIVLLFQRMAEDGDFGAQGVCEFDAHVTETAEAEDRYVLARAGTPMLQRRIERDAGAEQGRGGVQGQILRQAKNVVFIDHDLVGITAESRGAVRFPAVVGEDQTRVAVLLLPMPALGALAAGIDKDTDADFVSDLVLANFAADSRDDSRDFVARNHGEYGATPLIAGLMNVGMTNAAKLDVDDHVVLARLAAFKRIGRQRSLDGHRGVTLGLTHGASLSNPAVGFQVPFLTPARRQMIPPPLR